MHSPFVSRRLMTLAMLTASVAAATACQDKRVKELDTGITRDSAISVLATDIKGSGHEALPNVYKRSTYLINAKTLEVLYYTPNNEKPGKDTIPLRKLTPLVFYENKLIGKGWTALDSIAKANKLLIEEDSTAKKK